MRQRTRLDPLSAVASAHAEHAETIATARLARNSSANCCNLGDATVCGLPSTEQLQEDDKMFF